MGKPGFPIPRPAGGFEKAQPSARGLGNPVSPDFRPREGLGGRSPPKNKSRSLHGD